MSHEEMKAGQLKKHIKSGMIRIDSYGYAHLTEKGKARAFALVNKMPAGDEMLVELAVLEGHEVTVQV